MTGHAQNSSLNSALAAQSPAGVACLRNLQRPCPLVTQWTPNGLCPPLDAPAGHSLCVLPPGRQRYGPVGPARRISNLFGQAIKVCCMLAL